MIGTKQTTWRHGIAVFVLLMLLCGLALAYAGPMMAVGVLIAGMLLAAMAS